MINTLMSIGTFLSLLSTLPQFRAAWTNRHDLKGYSLLGSSALAIAMICFGTAFIFMGNWFSALCNIPVVGFWIFVSYHKVTEYLSNSSKEAEK